MRLLLELLGLIPSIGTNSLVDMARLIFVQDKFIGQTHALAQGKTTVGRGSQNSLVIPDSSVSVEHGLILTNGPEILVCERGSANGIFVDDIRVEGQAQVKSGQSLKFGAVITRLEIEDLDEGTQSEEMTAVWAHARAVRKEGEPTAPASTPSKLHTDEPTSPEEPTVTLNPPSTSLASPRSATGSSRVEPTASRSVRSWKLWILVGALLIVVTLVLWAARSRTGG